jgi:hypothetical protein
MHSLPGIHSIWSARRLCALALCLSFAVALGEAQAADAPALSPISDTAKSTTVSWVDPLESYYGNTLVCAAAVTGNDLCHLWLSRDGSFINFDENGAHTGHYQVGPMRPDGKVPVCQFWDTSNMLFLPGVPRPMMGPPPVPGAAPSMMLCHTADFHTTCRRGPGDQGIGPQHGGALLQWHVLSAGAASCRRLLVRG